MPQQGPGLKRAAARLAARVAIDCALAGGACLLSQYLLWRFATVKRWRVGFGARLGLALPPPETAGGLWIHTVSAGELLTAEPLIKRLAVEKPDLPLALSVTTAAAHTLASERLASIPRFFWPLDFSPVVDRVLARVRPRLIVLVELELWPNFLLGAARRGVPCLVINGRITAGSERRFGRVRPLARRLFNLVDRYGVQNEEYAARLERLGVPRDKLAVLGNLKFDVPRREDTPVAPVRAQLGLPPGRLVIVAGCTHPGEEELLLRALPQLPGAGLVLAPRHLERVPEVLALVRKSGRTPCTLGAGDAGDVLVVDRFGKLDSLYRAADLVVMGGTFVPHGGHNLLEPARWGAPIVFGPSIDNFRDIAVGLLDRGGAVMVPAPEEAPAALAALCASPERRAALGAGAHAVWSEGRGAIDRYLRLIDDMLRKETACNG